MPNAFATGRNSDHAVLCVTTGLMAKLNPEELEGVIAHEMSHVAHKDVQVMTAASFLAIIAALLIRVAFYGELFGGGGRGRGGKTRTRALIMFALMAVSIVVYAVSFLLIRRALQVPRAVRGPQRRAAHRPAERAEERAGQGQRGHGQDPDPGPAHGAAA